MLLYANKMLKFLKSKGDKIMKKLFILVTLLLGIMLTGCGAKEAKAMEEETVMEETVDEQNIEDEATEEETEILYSVDEAKSEMYSFMSDVLVEYEDYGLSEELRDDVIDICESVVYDESFEYGFDFIQWQKDMISTFVDHEVLPEVCRGMTIEELYMIYEFMDCL